MSQLEARYHHMQLVDPGIVDRDAQTYSCVILCGCGGCGDQLAYVCLHGDHWSVEVRLGYSQSSPGVWRWSRHARRSYRHAGSHAPRLPIPTTPRLQRLVTKHGDQVVRGPATHIIVKGHGAYDYALREKFAAFLYPGEAIMIGCQQASPHLSRVSYEALMRQLPFAARVVLPAN
jgi:hypothetical protein